MRQLFSYLFGEGYRRRVLAKRPLSDVCLAALGEALFLGFWIGTSIYGFRTFDLVFAVLWTPLVLRDGMLVYREVSRMAG